MKGSDLKSQRKSQHAERVIKACASHQRIYFIVVRVLEQLADIAVFSGFKCIESTE